MERSRALQTRGRSDLLNLVKHNTIKAWSDLTPTRMGHTEKGVLLTLLSRSAPCLAKGLIQVVFLLFAFSVSIYPQTWSTFLDSSRAVDWTGAGFSIPNYTTNCALQPTLTANSSGAASANTTAIQNALKSCDPTHNVVNIPAGTYYVAGLTFGTQGMQVLRGAGPRSTYIYTTGTVACGGFWSSTCMTAPDATDYSSTVGCSWTAGLAKGSTTLTLSSCSGAPPLKKMLILDQANDTTDNGGIYVCDGVTSNCNVEGNGSHNGRFVNGAYHSQQQVVTVAGVTSLGAGSYSITISPGVAFNNIRAGQNPQAWWPGFVQNIGLENITMDHGPDTTSNALLMMRSCYQCWVKNARFMNGTFSHVHAFLSANDVIRDSYFYQSQSHTSTSYGLEFTGSSGILVENNIFQQITNPIMANQFSASVIGYNYAVDSLWGSTGSWTGQAPDAGHDAGNSMNLWEGNNFPGIWNDDTWGASPSNTLFRNMLPGFQKAQNITGDTHPVSLELGARAHNIAGNVLGQSGYQIYYESYATSSTAGVNGGASAASRAIYALGWTGNGGSGGCNGPPVCDPLTRSTLMRWGNYDTVNNAVMWNATEASPGPAAYVNANFTPSYFTSLVRSLPSSLYYNSKPSWWPSTKAWPPVGPDVSSGNLGICSGGTLAGAQATSASQCTGGTFVTAYASHAASIPTHDCYLNVMNGPADGTGSVLNFDAGLCYTSVQSPPTRPASPTGLTATSH
jgi:hypothetical protein